MGGGAAGGDAGGVNDLMSVLFEEGETVDTAAGAVVDAASVKDDGLVGAPSPIGGLLEIGATTVESVAVGDIEVEGLKVGQNVGMGVEATEVTGQVEEAGSCPLDNQSSVNYPSGNGLLGGLVEIRRDLVSTGAPTVEPEADAVGAIEVEGLKVELRVGMVVEAGEVTGQVEEVGSCPLDNQSSLCHPTEHGLLDRHILAMENGQKQEVMEIGYTGATENVSAVPSSGITEGANATAMVAGIEVDGGSIMDYEASVSETFREEIRWLEENRELSSTGRAVQVQNQDVLLFDKDLVSVGAGTSATVPVVEAGIDNELLVSDDFRVTGDFVSADVGSGEVVEGIEIQTAGMHQVGDNAMDTGDAFMADAVSVADIPVVETQNRDVHLFDETNNGNRDLVVSNSCLAVETQAAVACPLDAFMADAGSVADIPVVETQSRDVYLIDDTNNGNGDLVGSSSCLAVETQAAVACPLDAIVMEGGDVVVEDLILANISMPETSEPSEIRQLASQGKESFVSIGDNQDMRGLSVGSSANRSLDADAHEEGSSRGISQMDMDANVLKEGFPAPDEPEVELVQRSEAEQLTSSLLYNMEDVVMDADVWIGDQELLEISGKQIPQCVARTPWTLCVEGNQKVHYNLPPLDTMEFSVSDLVWGKVKTHPWWPGQIFDHSDASELALKYRNKDNYLVAYFGDKSFAWRDKHQLKPFYASFSKMEKQSSSDAFICAVNDVLGEISRRTELGLMCSCLPEEEHDAMICQKVENAGIREGTNNSFDRSLVVNYFDRIRLLEYIKALAQIPTGGADRLELAIAKAQLKSFYRLKGYPELPEFISGRGLVEDGVEVLTSWDKKPKDFQIEHSTPISSESISGKRKRGRPPKKHKHVLNDVELSTSSGKTPDEFVVEHNTHLSSEMIPGKKKRGRPPKKKQKSLSRLTEEKNVSSLRNGSKSGSGVKSAGSANLGKTKKGGLYLSRNLGSSFDNGECLHDSGEIKRGRKESVVDLGNKSESPTLSSSFKVGEYIRRVASQLTGSSPIVKYHGDTFQKSVPKVIHGAGGAGVVDPDALPSAHVSDRRTKEDITEDCPSPDEMLSQLCLAASDPLEGCTALPVVVSFFIDYRNSFANSSEDNEHSRKTGGKKGRRKAAELESASDTSTPDHMKDSYCCDLISVDSSGKGQVSNGFKRKGETFPHKQKRKRKFSGKPDEMLSQLCLAARGPLLECTFLSMVVNFFTNFRNHCASNSSVGNKNSSRTGGNMEIEYELDSSDMPTPDHMKDSYWSDMSFVNSSGQGQVSNGLKRKGKMVLQKQSRKRKSAEQSSPSRFFSPIKDTAQGQTGTISADMKPALASERSIISVDDKIVDTPTALVLSFNSLKSLPSKADLIRIFSRYGPLRESETEVKRKTNRVKVVFRRRADAETAFSSAGKYSIFGPALLSYQLKYLPSAPTISPDSSPEGENDPIPVKEDALKVSAQEENGVVSNTAPVEVIGEG